MNKALFKVLSLFVVLSFANLVTFAQEEKQAETPSGNITLDFKEADITSVLKVIALRSGVNIVAGPEVQGTVTVRLADVPWEKALDVILKTYGFVYEREGNIIRVTTAEHLVKEGLQTEVYTLNYAKSNEAIESVRDMISERGKMRYDERANVLVVTDIPTNLYKIGQIVSALDKRTPQVVIETKLIETALNPFSESMGIDWNVQATVKGAKRPTSAPFRIAGSKPLSSKASEFLARGNPGGSTSIFPALETEETEGSAISFSPIFPYAIPGDFAFGTLDFSSFTATLKFLSSRTDTKLIASPRVATLNNKSAVIQVGETYKLPKFELNEATGRYEIVGFGEEIKVGVILTVTPHVNEKNEIVVDLHPEVSSWNNPVVIASTATTQTTALKLDKREVTTQVMVKDGETIAIGGLVREDISEKNTKVPILGDIPILGLPFKYKEKTITKKDLLIFVTIRLMEGIVPSEAEAIASETVSVNPFGKLPQEAAVVVTKAAEQKVPEQKEWEEGNKGYIFKK